jgi:polar amino acid transport system substrate-binding protein
VNTTRTRTRRALAALTVTALVGLAACGGGDDDADAASEATTAATDAPTGTGAAAATAPDATDNADAQVAAEVVEFDTDPAQPTRIRAEEVPEIAAQVPEAIASDGTLVVGHSAGNFPPLVLVADDETTQVGNEIDVAYLVADVLGLEVDLQSTSWENLFLSVESGAIDVGFSNITVTEERKEKFDFASYRVDSLAWEAAADSDITAVDGPEDVAGKSVAVGSGTNQEQVLLTWNDRAVADGLEPVDIQYYEEAADFLLALSSGRIDLYFGPAPSASYRHLTTGETKIVGTVPGGGDVPAQIAAMTVKGSGLAEPIAAALNHLIENGQYAEVLAKWGVEVESIAESEVNPPGLPKS